MAQEYYDPWSNTKTINGLEADLVISALQKCIRRGEEDTALRMAYELYMTSTFHEEKMWNRLLVIPVEDIGFGNVEAAAVVKNLYDLHKEFPYKDGDRPIFFMFAIRYLCKCQKERSTDHIKNIIMKEFDAGYVPEIPDYAIDMHTIQGRARGRDVFYFLDEASKVQPLWEKYDDSYRLKLYDICKKEAEQNKEGSNMKKMNRVAAAGMAAILAASALTACSSGNKPSETQAPEQTEVAKETDAPVADNGELKEVYVFIRDRGDLSYWDSMAEGADRSVTDYADRANVHVVETTADLQANLQAMYEAADAGADLIITASDFKDNLVEVANEFPDTAFAIISEDVIDQCENGNAYGVDFATSQAAYLGGIVAADLAESGVVGFIGGMDESLVIQEFLWGYIQGAKAYNPDIKIVYNYVGAWNDPDTAKTQAMTQYNDAKADVIFACAGGSGNGVHNAAGEADKYVIGVDSDQSLLYADDETIRSKFATSVVKEVGNAVYNVIGEWLDNGELPYGEYEILGLADGAVGIVEGDVLNGLLSDEGKAALEAAKAGIADGSVEVKSALGKSQDEVKAFINENCQ